MKILMRSLKLSLLALCLCIGTSEVGQAFFIDKLIKSPSIELPMADFVTTATTVGKPLMQGLSNVQAVKNQANVTVNAAMRAANSVTPFGMLDKIKEGENPGMMVIKKSNVCDIYDADSVEEAITELFFTYPEGSENSIEVRQIYERKAKEFYEDTLIEIFTASLQLQSYLKNDIKSTIEASGENTSKDVNDKNTGASKQAEGYERVDNLLMVLQKAIALKVQLRATKAIHKDVRPLTYEQQNNQCAADDLSPTRLAANNLTSSSAVSGAMPLAFAQVSLASKTTDTLKIADSSLSTAAQVNNIANSVSQVRQVDNTAGQGVISSAEVLDKVSSARVVSASPVAATTSARLTVASQVQDTAAAPKTAAVSAPETAVSSGSSAAAEQELADALAEIENISSDAGVSKAEGNLLVSATAFVEAPESELYHPYTDAKEQMDQLEKIAPISQSVDAATSAHNMMRDLPTYKSAVENYKFVEETHKKTLEVLKASDKCAINYIGRRFRNPEIVWSGRPLGEDVGNDELRSGLSGWAIEAYDTAKAAKVSSRDPEDAVLPDIDMGDTDLSDVTRQDERVELVSKIEITTANPGEEDEQDKEAREIDMISWQIGAEASKLLAAEPEKWGTLATDFPVWTDTKSFYNQYLTGKYENIRAYLKASTVSDVKAYVLAAQNSAGKDKNEKTARLKSAEKLDAALTQKRAQIQANREQELAANAAQYGAQIKVLEDQRQTLQDQLDASAQKVKAAGDAAYNKRQEIDQGTVNTMREKAVKQDSFRDYNFGSTKVKFEDDEPIIDEKAIEKQIQEETDKISKGASLEFHYSIFNHSALAMAYIEEPEDLSATYNASVSEKKADDSVIPAAKEITAAETAVSKQLRTKIEDVEAKIAELKLEMQKKAGDINEKFNKQEMDADAVSADQQAANEYKYEEAADKSLAGIISKTVDKLETAHAESQKNSKVPLPYSGPTRQFLTKGLDAAINSALSDLYAKVDARIDQAKSELNQLGDKLYDAAGYEKVKDIHTRLINDIKALPLQVNYTPLNIAVTLNLYQKILPADITPETEDYFVGSPAKERDMKAPKKILTYNLPPLREIFHFDEVDKQNVQPHENRPSKAKFSLKELIKKLKEKDYITREAFLNYGGDVPEIWKYMLKRKAFVEKEFNLEDALNQGCSQQMFFRGGFMPCKVRGGSQVLDIDENGQYYLSATTLPAMGECPSIESRGGTLYDTSLDLSIKLGGKNEGTDYNCPFSELGTILTADDQNRLTIRPKVREAYASVIEQQNASANGDETVESDDEQRQSMIYGNAMFATNQFGSFLKIKEQESTQRRAVEESKQKTEEMLKTLKELLKNYGFEPSEDFDISNEADYSLVRQKLNSIKTQSIADAKSQISKVDTADNDVIVERIEKYNKIIAALEKDKEAATPISDAVVENNRLDEDIKSDTVSKTVLDKHQKEADDTINKNVGSIQKPFCAAY